MKRARRNREAGLTLVELLITIIVAGLVASSTFVFFAGQQRIYETQTKVLTIQQNLWMAMEVMSRHLRAAGTGAVGCHTDSVSMTGATTPNTGVRVWQQASGLFRIPPVHIKNGVAGAPDEISFNFFTNTSGNYVDGQLALPIKPDFTGSAIKAVDTAPFRVGEFIMLFDSTTSPAGGDRGCSVYQLTGISAGSGSLLINASSTWNPPGHVAGMVPFEYNADNAGIRNLGTLNWVRIYIDAAGAPARAPRLMLDDFADGAPAQILAEGIEDMQIAYACDLQPAGNPDGAFTEGTTPAARLADEWTYNEPGDVPPTTCGMPHAIRVTLFGRSLNAETSLIGTAGVGSASSSFKAAVEDGVAGAFDSFRHRTLTTTVYPRN